jgi:hypothetical protein
MQGCSHQGPAARGCLQHEAYVSGSIKQLLEQLLLASTALLQIVEEMYRLKSTYA